MSLKSSRKIYGYLVLVFFIILFLFDLVSVPNIALSQSIRVEGVFIKQIALVFTCFIFFISFISPRSKKESNLLSYSLFDRKYKELLNTADTALWLVDAENFQTILHNEHYEKLCEKHPEISESNITKTFNNSTGVKTWREKYKRALSGNPVKFEITSYQEDNIRYFSARIHPTKKNGKVIWLCCSCKDITFEKKRIFLNTKRIIEGQEKERDKISRILHDGVIQMLAGIKIKVQILNPEKVDTFDETRGEILSYLDSSINQVRNLSHEIATPDIEDGILPFIRENFAKLNKVYPDINFCYSIDVDDNEVKIFDDLNLCRIIQEFINNSVKYAKCSELCVQASLKGDFVEIQIADNGVGFDVESSVEKGLGLKNIKNRALIDHIQHELQSEPGKGTKLSLRKRRKS